MIKKNPDKVITEDDVFRRTHKRKQGADEFVDVKSKQFFEDYTAQKKSEGFDSTTWVNAFGGVAKNRLYVFGSLVPASEVMSSSTCSSFSRPNGDFTHTQEFEDKVSERVEKIKAQLQSENATEMEKIKVDFQLQLQEALRSLRGFQM